MPKKSVRRVVNNRIERKDRGVNIGFFSGIISEISLFFFLYYVQYMFSVQGNIWFSSLVMWVLLNLIFLFSPLLRKF